MQNFGFSFVWSGSIFIGNLGDKLQDIASSLRKPKVKKKGSDDISAVIQPDPAELQGRATGDILNSLSLSFLIHFMVLLLTSFFRCNNWKLLWYVGRLLWKSWSSWWWSGRSRVVIVACCWPQKACEWNNIVTCKKAFKFDPRRSSCKTLEGSGSPNTSSWRLIHWWMWTCEFSFFLFASEFL